MLGKGRSGLRQAHSHVGCWSFSPRDAFPRHSARDVRQLVAILIVLIDGKRAAEVVSGFVHDDVFLNIAGAHGNKPMFPAAGVQVDEAVTQLVVQ